VYGAALETCRACAPRLRELAGAELAADGRVSRTRKIVNTAAAALWTGEPGQSPLAAASGAVVGLTRVLARELGGFGVTVNAVVPGFVETRLTEPEPAEGETGVAESLRQMLTATTALGRPGQPADVASVHTFLASDDADFVTGATIPVTGGMLGTLA
jgi:3-oxoacyl-[acyl-carrier protein] reductase